jgi:O-antigen/teichoic acid export membrane protein
VVNILAALIVRVQYGVGQQGTSNAWQIAGSLAGLGATYGAASLDPGKTAFIAAAAFAPVAVSLINTVHYFVFTSRGRSVCPVIGMLDPAVMRELVSLGGRFLLITVLLAVTTQSDLWIVSWTSGLENVADYAIPYRVFSVIGALALVLTLPLWPLNAEAVASGDVAWIQRITRKMLLANVVVVGGLSALAALVGPWLVDIWLDGTLDRQPVLWTGLALWWFAQCLSGPAFMAQNGAEVLRPQTIGYLVMLVSLPVKWWVGSNFGYEWIPWAGTAFYVLVIWPAAWIGYDRSIRMVRARLSAVVTVSTQPRAEGVKKS